MPSKNVVNTIIIDKEGAFLTIKRTKTAPRHALHWDLPGGHVEKGESLEKAATREAFEETNLKIEDLRPAKVENSFRNYFITTKYSGNIEFKKNPESGFVEHNKYKWVTLEEYKKLPNLSINPKEIEEAMEILSKKALYEQKYQERMMLLLKEGRKENVFKKYSRLGEEYLEFLAKADEENNYKHLAWMAKQLSKDTDWDNYSDYGKLEATKDMAKYLEKFLDYQPRLKRKDINQYKNGDEIIMAIHKEVLQPQIDRTRKKRAADPRTQQMVKRGEGRIIYEDDTFFVVRPETEDASCFFGAQSSWCIAQLGNGYFNEYTEKEGKVFYFIKNDGLRTDDTFRQMAVQMSRDGFEMFWDRHDEPYELYTADWEEFAEFVNSETEIPLNIAEAIFEGIYTDFEDYPPTGGELATLDGKVDRGEYDTKYARFDTGFDDWGENQMYMSPSCYVTLQVSLSDNESLDRFLTSIQDNNLDHDDIGNRIDDILNGRTEFTDFNGNDYYFDPDELTYPMLEELGFSYPEENLDYSKRERMDDLVTFKIVGRSGNWFAEISFGIDYGMYTLDETMTSDADDAENFFSNFSDTYADDANFDDIVDYVIRCIPELNIGGGTLEKIYDDFYNMSEKFENIRLSFDVDLPGDGVSSVIMKSKEFILPISNPELLNQKVTFEDYREQMLIVLKETFDSFYNEAILDPKQKQFDFGEKYKAKKITPPKYDMSLYLYDDDNVKASIKAAVNFMQTPEEIYNVYEFFKMIDKYFPQILKMLARVPQSLPGLKAVNESLAIAEKKKKKKKSSGKKDACYHKVKSRYKVWPSAYASGALVKCRKVGAKNWGNSKKEELEIAIHNEMSILEEAPDDMLIKKIYSVLEKEGGAAGLDAIESQTGATSEEIAAIIEKEADIKVHDDGDIIDMSGLGDDIKEEIKKYLTEKKKKKKKAGTESSKESSLRDWFGRKGAKGSKKGWVDCNAPDGKGGYKACGRSSGEKRKKYPACRPTPGACKERGKGKSWGKKAKKKGKK